MSLKKLSVLTNLVFGMILVMGVIYVVLTGLIFAKTFPGMVMFLIYIYDSFRGGVTTGEIASMHLLLATVIFWCLSLFMAIKIVKAIKNTAFVARSTKNFIKELKVVRTKGILNYFDSVNGEIFTAGFFRPEVYISNNLQKMHTAEEIRAMITHEKRHVKVKDPLRTTLVAMIGKALPDFPMKEKITRYFYTLTEVCADKAAEIKMDDKLPVVSALYKRLKNANAVVVGGINFFNSQSERISVLVGKSRLNNKICGVESLITFGMMVLVWLFTKVNFYNCSHLINCVLSFSSAYDLH